METFHLIQRVHAVIIGPGLGRDEVTLEIIRQIIPELRSMNMPMVIDADGLFLLSEAPNLIQGEVGDVEYWVLEVMVAFDTFETRVPLSGYSQAILTPNHNEYIRLCKTKVNNCNLFINFRS